MNLGETRIGKECSLFVGAVGGGNIAAARIGRQIKHVAVAAGGQHNRVSREPLNLTSPQTASDDALGVAVHQYQVEHLRLRKHLNGAGRDLSAQRLVTP